MFSASSLGITLCTFFALFALAPAETEPGAESGSGLIQELRAALADLAVEGRTHLGRLAGEQTVLSVQKVSNISVVLPHLHTCSQRQKREM